jgi:hypothetical protein
MTVILSQLGEFEVPVGPAEGLWVEPAEATAMSGWELRPEGLCRGDVCVPVPPGKAETLTADGKINLAAFWDHMGMPIAHSADGDVWALGEGAENRTAELRSLEAPDFTQPDLAGVQHSLSDHRGKKILLATWASW